MLSPVVFGELYLISEVFRSSEERFRLVLKFLARL